MKVLILRHEKDSNLTTLIDWANQKKFGHAICSFAENKAPTDYDYDILFSAQTKEEILSGLGHQEKLHSWFIE